MRISRFDLTFKFYLQHFQNCGLLSINELLFGFCQLIYPLFVGIFSLFLASLDFILQSQEATILEIIGEFFVYIEPSSILCHLNFQLVHSLFYQLKVNMMHVRLIMVMSVHMLFLLHWSLRPIKQLGHQLLG